MVFIVRSAALTIFAPVTAPPAATTATASAMTNARRGISLTRTVVKSSILSSARSVAWPRRNFRFGFHSRPVRNRLNGVRRTAEAIIHAQA